MKKSIDIILHSGSWDYYREESFHCSTRGWYDASHQNNSIGFRVILKDLKNP